MLDKYTRFYMARIMTPVARAFLRAHISPDLVTVVGTAGVCVGALAFYPRGEFLWGTLFITAFVFSDNLDGVMARLSGRESKWGAFLDSVLDRIGDAAIFAGLALWFAGRGDNLRMTALLIACVALGGLISYARARAESLGFSGRGGIVERAERLIVILVATGVAGLLDLPPVVLEVVVWILTVASAVTVFQRVWGVRKQVAVTQ